MTDILFLHKSWNKSIQNVMWALSRNSSTEKTDCPLFFKPIKFSQVEEHFPCQKHTFFSPNTKFTGFLFSFLFFFFYFQSQWSEIPLSLPFTQIVNHAKENYGLDQMAEFSPSLKYFCPQMIKYVELELFWQQRRLRCFFIRVTGTAWGRALPWKPQSA